MSDSYGYAGTNHETAEGLRKLANEIENRPIGSWRLTKIFHTVKVTEGFVTGKEPSGGTTIVLSNLRIPDQIIRQLEQL